MPKSHSQKAGSASCARLTFLTNEGKLSQVRPQRSVYFANCSTSGPASVPVGCACQFSSGSVGSTSGHANSGHADLRLPGEEIDHIEVLVVDIDQCAGRSYWSTRGPGGPPA